LIGIFRERHQAVPRPPVHPNGGGYEAVQEAGMSGAYRYLLDTNAASALIRGRVGPEVQQLLIDHSACISVITEAELRFGVARRPVATRLATAVGAFLQGTPVLPWTSDTAHAYAELRALLETTGVGLSAMDLLIAAQARAEDCTLISADSAFVHVPELRVLDWSANRTPTSLKTKPRKVLKPR